MVKITVHLKKYNNQSRQYHPLLVFEVTPREIQQALSRVNTEVETFYVYEYELVGVSQRVYSVSPALFDHLETIVT